MKKIILIIFILFMWTVGIPRLYASMAQAGAKGLLLSSTARESSLAEACVALNDSINSINYNPAGIAGLTKYELSFQHTSWLVDTQYQYFGFLYPLYKSAFAVSLTYIDYGSFKKRDSLGSDLGSFKAYDYTADITYASAVTSRIDAGIRLRYYSQKIDTYSANAVPFDLGVVYKAHPERLIFGFAVQNLGSRTTELNTRSEKLPRKIRMGASMRPGGDHLGLFFEHDIISERCSFTNLGAELDTGGFVLLRLGVSNSTEYDENIRLKAGVGINLFGYHLDYAYEPFSDLGNCHKINLRIKFN